MLGKVKKALTSHYLFDNWYSLLIKYVLARLGLNVKLRTKIGNCVIEFDPEVFERFVSGFHVDLSNQLNVLMIDCS